MKPDSLRRDLRDLARILRREVPPLLPVEIRRVPLADAWGDTTLYEDRDGLPLRFLVRVDRAIEDQAGLYFVLSHEWAHTLTWSSAAPKSPRWRDHGTDFWLAVGRVYRATRSWRT